MNWYDVGRVAGLVAAPLIAGTLVYVIGLVVARFQGEPRARRTRRRFALAGFAVWVVIGLILLEHYLRGPRPGG